MEAENQTEPVLEKASGTTTNMTVDVAFQNVVNVVRAFMGNAQQHELLSESLIVIRNHLLAGSVAADTSKM